MTVELLPISHYFYTEYFYMCIDGINNSHSDIYLKTKTLLFMHLWNRLPIMFELEQLDLFSVACLIIAMQLEMHRLRTLSVLGMSQR